MNKEPTWYAYVEENEEKTMNAAKDKKPAATMTTAPAKPNPNSVHYTLRNNKV